MDSSVILVACTFRGSFYVGRPFQGDKPMSRGDSIAVDRVLVNEKIGRQFLTTCGACLEKEDFSDYPELLYLPGNNFEEIAAMPCYYIPQLETEALILHAQTIASTCCSKGIGQVVEIGAGSSPRLALLLQAMIYKGVKPVVHLCDLDEATVTAAAERLRERFGDDAYIQAYGGWSHEDVVRQLPVFLAEHGPALVTQLGHNLGNYAPHKVERMMTEVRRALDGNGAVLVGLDGIPRTCEELDKLRKSYRNEPTERFLKYPLQILAQQPGVELHVEALYVDVGYDTQVNAMMIGLRTPDRIINKIGSCTYLWTVGTYLKMECSYRYSIFKWQKLASNAGFETIRIYQDQLQKYMLSLQW